LTMLLCSANGISAICSIPAKSITTRLVPTYRCTSTRRFRAAYPTVELAEQCVWDILKHMHNLSDEALCERWVENPYFQYFCGEVVFRHELPFDRSSLTRCRQRLGEEQIAALLQESLSVAHRTGAIDRQAGGAGGRNYLPGRDGDRVNAVLAAAGYNFSLLLRWFEELLRVLSLILCHALLAAPLHLTRGRKTFFTADSLSAAHLD
jgi:hypothetical protein